MARTPEAHPVATLAALAMLAASVACTGMPPASAAGDDARAGIRARGPGALFHSVEAAALDALANAHRTAGLQDRRRLRVGTIHRVANGFSYAAPRRAAASSPLMPQSVRYRLRPMDVASYVISPRSTQRLTTRPNQTPSRETRRIVDELDPAHRPVYVLTPSLDVVRYARGGETRVLTSLRAPRRAMCVAALDVEKSVLARADAPCARPELGPALPSSAPGAPADGNGPTLQEG